MSGLEVVKNQDKAASGRKPPRPESRGRSVSVDRTGRWEEDPDYKKDTATYKAKKVSTDVTSGPSPGLGVSSLGNRLVEELNGIVRVHEASDLPKHRIIEISGGTAENRMEVKDFFAQRDYITNIMLLLTSDPKLLQNIVYVWSSMRSWGTGTRADSTPTAKAVLAIPELLGKLTKDLSKDVEKEMTDEFQLTLDLVLEKVVEKTRTSNSVKVQLEVFFAFVAEVFAERPAPWAEAFANFLTVIVPVIDVDADGNCKMLPAPSSLQAIEDLSPIKEVEESADGSPLALDESSIIPGAAPDDSAIIRVPEESGFLQPNALDVIGTNTRGVPEESGFLQPNALRDNQNIAPDNSLALKEKPRVETSVRAKSDPKRPPKRSLLFPGPRDTPALQNAHSTPAKVRKLDPVPMPDALSNALQGYQQQLAAAYQGMPMVSSAISHAIPGQTWALRFNNMTVRPC